MKEHSAMSFSVYLSGEIHTDWRDEIQRGAEAAGLDVEFTSPVTDHPASDAAGDHLGSNTSQFWRDHQSAKVNAIRTDRKSTRLNSSHVAISYAVFCLKKKN